MKFHLKFKQVLNNIFFYFLTDKGLPINRCAEESTDGFMPDLAFAKYGYFRYHFNQYSMRGLWHVRTFKLFKAYHFF